MLITHKGKTPVVDPSAYIAPNAAVCGDVTIGANCRILFGAQIIAEGGSIAIGDECIVMENAVLRSHARHPLRIGNNCLIGPSAHVVGCTIEDEVFIATGAAIFHGAHLQRGCEVRIHGIVHLKSRVHAGDVVPIGWIAVGDPAAILPLEDHEKIWELLKPLNFPLTVYGFDRPEADMVKITRRLAETLASHRDDTVEDDGP
jgi:carbonic anhydrase/acetyltransferase-like protein (isoleucine patch superfamily)